MSFMRLVGVTTLILIVLAGVLTSLFALDLVQPAQLFSKEILQSPLQASLLFLAVLILVLLVIVLSVDTSEEEELVLEQLRPEHLHSNPIPVPMEELGGVSFTYPAINLQSQADYVIESVEEKVRSFKEEPEFRRFLKNAILELEREKARIYHEVSLLDQDYRKGIITEKEFLMGTQLILEDRGLQETIEEKDRQIEACKSKILEAGLSKSRPEQALSE